MRVTIQRADNAAVARHRRAIADAGLGALLRACGTALAIGSRASLTVRISDDAELGTLNGRFLGNDGPTDVLAFPGDTPGHVGDVAISVERAAVQGGGDTVRELRLLAVHGLLHCIGHDHAVAADAARMTEATRRLLPGEPVPELVVVSG
jgi:probable rRNA maturation factor